VRGNEVFMSRIRTVRGREVLDSRGNPTVECDVETDDGLFRAMVPSGASAGIHEAVELRDGGRRFHGRGTRRAVDNINNIMSKKIVGMDCTDQNGVDDLLIELDGTENKEQLGANAILAVSIAVCKAGAAATGKKLYEYVGELYGKPYPRMLPVPQHNIINGGKHAGQENSIQEHMIMPVGAKSFREALRMASEIYHALKNILKKRLGAGAVLIGDEGGFAPPQLKTIHERLDILMEAISSVGYEDEIKLAIDSASSEFFEDGIYRLEGKEMSAGELIDYYSDVVSSYPIVSWEDGMAEDDWDGWVEMTKKLGDRIQIVGDDLLVTNPRRIKKAIEIRAANSALIKLNQIGTVTETLEAVKLAHSNRWTAVCSHRSGETEDSFLADFTVGVSSSQIKCGAPARSERLSKYNQLLRIEEELDKEAKYPGEKFRTK